MNVLAFDTSSAATVVGLLRSDKAVFAALDRRSPGERPGHQERMLPLAGQLLAGAQLQLAAIERIAVGIGPGTFTGLRVGVATARALAQALACAIVPVSSLQALACSAAAALGGRQTAGELAALALTDARRGELFAASYLLCGEDQSAWERLPAELLAPRAIAPCAVRELIAQARAAAGARELVAVGDGVPMLSQELERAGVIVPQPAGDAQLIDGGALARLGALGRPVAIVEVLPDYCRAPDAQIARAGARGQVEALA